MNHQFTTEILHQNQFGHVSVCVCCEEMQLGFGNILIQLPIQGLINLSEVPPPARVFRRITCGELDTISL
jgi:hypothetical protein